MKASDQTILYAEDTETDAYLFQHALRRAGVTQRLQVVADGHAAIDYLADAIRTEEASNRIPVLALLDVKMPAITGFEVLNWIRATPGLFSMVTLMFSSSHHPRDVQRAYALGANGYLVKPCTIDETVNIVKALKDYWLTYNHVPTKPSVGLGSGEQGEGYLCPFTV